GRASRAVHRSVMQETIRERLHELAAVAAGETILEYADMHLLPARERAADAILCRANETREELLLEKLQACHQTLRLGGRLGVALTNATVDLGPERCRDLFRSAGFERIDVYRFMNITYAVGWK